MNATNLQHLEHFILLGKIYIISNFRQVDLINSEGKEVKGEGGGGGGGLTMWLHVHVACMRGQSFPF